MANFLDDNPDLKFYFENGVDWKKLADLTELRFGHGEAFEDTAEALAFYREVASTIGAFAAEEVAPYAAEIDRQGVVLAGGEVSFPPRLAAIFKKMAELELFGLTLPRELGGMNAPMLLYFVAGEMLGRADVSTMSHFGFHGGIAMAMLVLSLFEGSTTVDPVSGRIVRTRWSEEIAEIVSGRAWGSMDITEPDAGSDMAALRSVARQDEAGAWTVSGEKIFITSGHGKYHFVVARTDGGAGRNGTAGEGLKGLSMFLVPAYRDEADGSRTRFVNIDRIEEKLGHHGSATAALSFDRARAELVGKQGDGFRLMLEIMNNARIAVGFEAIGLSEAALRMARAYAAERRSMGKTLDRHELIADYLDEMQTDIAALRALAMHAAHHEELGHKFALFGRVASRSSNGNGAHGADPDRKAREHRARARRATPLLKYLAAERAVEIARRNLQIHGGNGYMREFGAEKLLRDALVLPIYEGTSQIQALMATKDTLTGIVRGPRDFLRRVAEARIRALWSRDPLERGAARIEQLSLGAQQYLVRRLASAKLKSVRGTPLGTWSTALTQGWDARKDFGPALLHAERLTRLLGDELIAHVLLEQARRHPERRPLLERYLHRAEPRARFLHDEITNGSDLERRSVALRGTSSHVELA